MLNSINLNDKSYEEMLAQALSQIPLYSDEWTNFNVSDPGITILQNFTAFHLLQQSHINEVTEEIRRRLLKLLGIEAGENAGAKVWLKAMDQGDGPLHLPEHHKLHAGELCFETARPVTLSPCELLAVYTQGEAHQKDITYLLDRDVPTGASIFGPAPKAGMALTFILSALPGPGEALVMYAAADDSHKRSPFAPGQVLPFAKVKWEYYTDAGFQPISVTDETNCFLLSGTLHFQMPEAGPAVYDPLPETGYALRCTLLEANYDLPPKLLSLTVNLFEAVQRETKAASFVFDGMKSIELFSEMAQYDTIFVYAREKRGQPLRLYKEYTGWQKEGRFFKKTPLENGGVGIEFDKLQFGFAPLRSQEAIYVVCYEEEMVHHRLLGTIYGYEDQILDIDLTENLESESVSLMIEVVDEDGDVGYLYATPDRADAQDVYYTVLSQQGQICIRRWEMEGACRAFLCDCVVTEGSGGNIRGGNQFRPRISPRGEDVPLYFNPSAGTGGHSRETAEELRLQLVAEMNRPTAAVLASDYEAIVKETPGLCIHKVKAVAREENHLVKVAVKPYTEERFSQMSPVYLREIGRHLDRVRMITTKVELVQPRYVPIDVQGAIYVKSYYENSQQEIEALLHRELDYIDSDRKFGELVRFNELYQKLEALPCVDHIYELILSPQSRGDALLVGADIQLGDNCLCYLGRLSLELSTRMGTS